MRDADDRRNASIITHSSMMFRSTSEHVGCTMKTSVPRMFSSIWNEHSVSGNRWSRAWPVDTPRNSAISLASAGCALPENSFNWPPFIRASFRRTRTRESTNKVVGAGGFEPPKYGSQSPAPYRLATPHRRSVRPQGLRRPRGAKPDGAARPHVRKRLSLPFLRAFGNRAGAPLVFGAGERPRQERPCAAPRERLDTAGGGEAAAKQAENCRAAARHRGRQGASFLQRRFERANLGMAPDHRR